MTYQFTGPGRTIIGEQALETAGSIMKEFGKKALIVTGKHVTKQGIAKMLTDCLAKQGISWEIYSEITSEPTDTMIYGGVEVYKKADCDFCIGIGGGSPLDSAKAIAAMAVNGGSISDYMGKEIGGVLPPLVLIPTTAGTGSETTKFTIITDTEKNVKMLLKGEKLLPDLAVIDPEFTVSAPKSVTAATGMDALAHAVESFTSRKGNPLTDMYALSAVKRIFTYLPRAYQDGTDREARREMALAAYEAGVCINNASVTIVHGMSRPIGALFHVPHGISNAMLMKECFAYVMDGCYDKFSTLAGEIGACTPDCSAKEGAEKFLEALDQLCDTLEIPTLEGYGIDRAEFEGVMDKMAGDAMASGSPSNTMKEITKEDLLVVYRKLWEK